MRRAQLRPPLVASAARTRSRRNSRRVEAVQGVASAPRALEFCSAHFPLDSGFDACYVDVRGESRAEGIIQLLSRCPDRPGSSGLGQRLLAPKTEEVAMRQANATPDRHCQTRRAIRYVRNRHSVGKEG